MNPEEWSSQQINTFITKLANVLSQNKNIEITFKTYIYGKKILIPFIKSVSRYITSIPIDTIQRNDITQAVSKAIIENELSSDIYNIETFSIIENIINSQRYSTILESNHESNHESNQNIKSGINAFPSRSIGLHTPISDTLRATFGGRSLLSTESSNWNTVAVAALVVAIIWSLLVLLITIRWKHPYTKDYTKDYTRSSYCSFMK